MDSTDRTEGTPVAPPDRRLREARIYQMSSLASCTCFANSNSIHSIHCTRRKSAATNTFLPFASKGGNYSSFATCTSLANFNSINSIHRVGLKSTEKKKYRPFAVKRGDEGVSRIPTQSAQATQSIESTQSTQFTRTAQFVKSTQSAYVSRDCGSNGLSGFNEMC